MLSSLCFSSFSHIILQMPWFTWSHCTLHRGVIIIIERLCFSRVWNLHWALNAHLRFLGILYGQDRNVLDFSRSFVNCKFGKLFKLLFICCFVHFLPIHSDVATFYFCGNYCYYFMCFVVLKTCVQENVLLVSTDFSRDVRPNKIVFKWNFVSYLTSKFMFVVFLCCLLEKAFVVLRVLTASIFPADENILESTGRHGGWIYEKLLFYRSSFARAYDKTTIAVCVLLKSHPTGARK